MSTPLPLPRALAAIREAIDTLTMQRSTEASDQNLDGEIIDAGLAAVLQIEAAATKVHDALSLYHAMAADLEGGEPEIADRAEEALLTDGGHLAVAALTYLGLSPKAIKSAPGYQVENATVKPALPLPTGQHVRVLGLLTDYIADVTFYGPEADDEQGLVRTIHAVYLMDGTPCRFDEPEAEEGMDAIHEQLNRGKWEEYRS